MKVVFNKSNLPFLKKTFSEKNSGRDYWTLARRMSDNDTFTNHSDREEFLLTKGAFKGDVYSMCELARYIFNSDRNRLPQALSWWHKAALHKDDGATFDIKHLPLEKRILEYKTYNSEYADIEIKCALFVELCLTDLGLVDWKIISEEEKINRCNNLFHKVSSVLGIKEPELIFEETPNINDCSVADGLAYPNEWILKVRKAILNDYERLIQVLFHELGHFVVFSMWGHSFSPNYLDLRKKYGITDRRADAWYNGERNPDNENLPATEEDPDTLSYGVWMTWCIYFKN